MGIAFFAVVLRWITDWTCSPYSQVCKAGSEVLSHVYAVVFSFLAIVAMTKAKQIKDLVQRFKTAFEVLLDTKAKND